MINKYIIPSLLIYFIFISGFSYAQQEKEIVMMSYNIRMDTPVDGINTWDKRKARLTAFVLEQGPDILGVQEALPGQMHYLQSQMPDFSYVGVGREDGLEKGEFSAIFYNHQRFILLDKGNFWLSQTPEVPGSMGWDAACTRICSWAKLQNRQTKGVFFVFNTHWDHMGVLARENSASLITRKIKEIAGKSPVMLSGDFNCTDTSKAMQTLLKGKPQLTSTRNLVKPEGPDYSFAGFLVGGEKGDLIDHIFLSKDIQALSYRISDKSYEGNYLSDHFPVIVKLRLPK